jgi:hypothetical protein
MQFVICIALFYTSADGICASIVQVCLVVKKARKASSHLEYAHNLSGQLSLSPSLESLRKFIKEGLSY